MIVKPGASAIFFAAGCIWPPAEGETGLAGASQVARVVKKPPANAGDMGCGLIPGSG